MLNFFHLQLAFLVVSLIQEDSVLKFKDSINIFQVMCQMGRKYREMEEENLLLSLI